MIRAVIVDDEEPARVRMRRLLEGTGVAVVGEAGDGDSAVEEIDALTPDVVFLDIQMPVASGLDVAARLRAPKPRIVFCTAFDRFAIDAFEHHALDYLLKPVNRARLAQTLERVTREVVEQQRRSRELAEAARTQARLMPPARAIHGLDVAGICVPAEGVGGDYYDVLALEPQRIAVVVGDVSGKGMYAGIIAAAIQARLQTIVAKEAAGPAAILTELNRLTVDTIESHRFATVFLATIDPAASTFTWANGGHTPAVIVGTEGVRTLSATGPMVGWSDEAAFTESTESFRPGDVLAVFSDGLTEAANAEDVEFGVEGVSRAIERHAMLKAEEIARAVLDDVRGYAVGAAAHDDRTIVVVKR